MYKHASQLLLEFKQFDDIKSKFSDKKNIKPSNIKQHLDPIF